MLTAEWLVEREERYGGYVEMEHANGGDRMSVHGYAEAYAETLSDFIERNGTDVVLVEIGVLRGTGLAIWGDLFGTVVGLDIDLGHFWGFVDELSAAGAFWSCELRLATFDQRTATPDSVADALGGLRPSIVIDDGCHEDSATLRTLESFRRHLTEDFLYFVEDQPRRSKIHETLQGAYGGWFYRGAKAQRLHQSLTVLAP